MDPGAPDAATPTAMVEFENERPIMPNIDRHSVIMQTSQPNNNNIVDADATASGCNGCTTITSFYEARDAASISSSDDVTPTTSSTDSTEKSEVDSSGNNTFAAKKGKAEGMMDIALLTANANQLRFLITYNTETRTFYISTGLIVLSLIIQVLVGMALIFKRQMKKRGKRNHVDKTSDFLVSGVFLVTVINVLAASFTTTASPPGTTSTQTHSHLARASMMASAASAVVLPTTSQPAN